ncbi:MAG: PDZ domain-containing protein [bacterium]|jgi:hypothetical protein
MFPWVEITIMILKLMPQVIINPLFWLVIMIIHSQYKRLHRMEKEMFGVNFSSLRKQVWRSVLYGLVGGIAGSYILTLVGVSLSGAGINYVWPVAIALMLISPRLMCFAYAGGLVSLFSLVFGFPEIEIPQLMALVAVLHMIESILIWLTGHKDPTPVIIKKPSGELVGGFNLHKFWPIPVVVMLTLLVEEPETITGLLQMPQWWPVIKPQEIPADGHELIYSMFLVVAALGYSDVALTCYPQEKARKSAILLGLYSIVLLFAAIGASFFPPLLVGTALLAPFGHELVVHFGGRKELRGTPIFVAPEQGVMVLTTVPGSIAQKLGITTGDVILEVGGKVVRDPLDLAGQWEQGASTKEMVSLRRTGDSWQRHFYSLPEPKDKLGIIPVPAGDTPYMEIKTQGALQRWLQKLLWRWKGDRG